MSLETQMEILNNQLRQILQLLDAQLLTSSSSGLKPIDVTAGIDKLTGEKNSLEITLLTDEEIAALNLAKEEGLFPAINVSGLPPGEIEWDNVDIMNCPFHSGMMSSSHKTATTGKSKGCWNKKRSAVYSDEQYTLDRRTLMAQALDRAELGLPALTADVPPQLTPDTDNAPQLAPPQADEFISPESTAGPIDDPSASFDTIVQRHINLYGADNPGCIYHLLRQCNFENWETADTSLMEADPTLTKVVPWIRKTLVAHHAAESQQ